MTAGHTARRLAAKYGMDGAKARVQDAYARAARRLNASRTMRQMEHWAVRATFWQFVHATLTKGSIFA